MDVQEEFHDLEDLYYESDDDDYESDDDDYESDDDDYEPDDDVLELCNACKLGDDNAVKNILERGLVDINAGDKYGNTPLMCAVDGNNPRMVKTLLGIPGIRVDIADMDGFTALHGACCSEKDRSSLIPLLAQHRSCTSAVINQRDSVGRTPLMLVNNLECVKELGKLEGTNFRTKNNRGETLLDVARESKYNIIYDDKMIKYLLEKQKKETLEEKAAYQVARLIKNEDDVEKLEIPQTLYSVVKKFLDY